MAQMKTPGVYLVEKDAFPNSVVEVATAVPAFIGYTEKAQNGIKSLLNKPFRISSFAEYMQYFGGSPEYKFDLKAIPAASAAKAPKDDDKDSKSKTPPDGKTPLIPDLTVNGKGYMSDRY